MTTFWTGSALAADYGQGRVLALRRQMRAVRVVQDDAVLAAQLEALGNLNRAIDTAVLAQFDEQEAGCAIDDDDVVLHSDCMESAVMPRLVRPVRTPELYAEA